MVIGLLNVPVYLLVSVKEKQNKRRSHLLIVIIVKEVHQIETCSMQLEEKYITDKQGNRIGILLDIEEYQRLLEELDQLYAIKAYYNAILSDY